MIVLLIAMLPASIPVVYYSFKLRGFAIYSKMWKPWKKLALGWLMMLIAVISGITEFGILLITGIFNQRIISWITMTLLVAPMGFCVFTTLYLTITGIKQFYLSAKIAINPNQEIEKLRYIIIIHKSVGATIYDKKLGEWELDPDLIGGFLGVLQRFSSKIKRKDAPMRKMEYKDFEIILEQGKYAIFSLFIDGNESDWIREKLNFFTKEFEKKYEENFKQWSGETTTFEKSDFLVERIFELYRL
ncbi:MAG: hypothetical protein HWN67_14515 [Candidatus Helarchaeota archaeon]|nr:hypothetical protein [Candidatus Helarchaeota archaeon]